MSENETDTAANELLAQGQSVVSAKAEDVIAGLSSVKEVDLLKAALIAEQAGKGRTTVVKALEDAIAGLEAPDGGDALNEAAEAEARAQAEAEATRIADLERREAEVAQREEAVSRAEAELLNKASVDSKPNEVETPEPTDPGPDEIDTSDHVEMIRDEPQFEGGPTEALVHPDEVENYIAGGWKED